MFSTRQVMAVFGYIGPGAPETLRENAERFAKVVVTLAKDRRFVLCYPHQGYRGVRREEHGWHAMANPEWRALVLELLADAPVADAVFTPPDSLDGWTFSARSTVPVPYIAKLTLEDNMP